MQATLVKLADTFLEDKGKAKVATSGSLGAPPPRAFGYRHQRIPDDHCWTDVDRGTKLDVPCFSGNQDLDVETDSGTPIPEVFGLLQYRVTKDAIGKFTSFTCTPVRNDGIVGSPRLLSLQIIGTAVEGSIMTVDRKYWGGKEGESVFRWFRTSSDGTHSEIKDATTSSYTLSVDDIGFFISVSCEPVRSDWARGPVVLSEQIGPIIPGPPSCQLLEFHGSFVEGERLSFFASYSGGEKGDCLSEWFRVKSNGLKDKLNAGEFFDLTIEDVGRCVELVYTPVRKDGVKGTANSVMSSVVAPADPMGLELVIPDCCEDKMVVPQKKYFGGQEGDGEYVWYRTKNILHGPALMDISNACDVFICGKTLTYTPSLEDIGAYLALYWLPTRADGKCGKPLVSICNSSVTPALPVVSNVHVKELSSGTYFGEGEYFGGYEGPSLFSWYRETNEGTIILINGANSRTYQVTDSDYNCRLLFGSRVDCKGSQIRLRTVKKNRESRRKPQGPNSDQILICKVRSQTQFVIRFTCRQEQLREELQSVRKEQYFDRRYMPVRSDSVVGERRLSEPTDIILPELLKIEMLALTGKAVEGDVLTAVEVIPKSEIQQHVWGKYKNDVRYQWFCSSETGNDVSLEPLSSQRSCSYKVRLEDIGRCLRCECIVTDVFGRSSQSAYAETAPILPGIPRIDKLEIEGRGFHTNLYAVRGVYSGGKEGKSRIQWLRSMVGSPDLISIPGTALAPRHTFHDTTLASHHRSLLTSLLHHPCPCNHSHCNPNCYPLPSTATPFSAPPAAVSVLLLPSPSCHCSATGETGRMYESNVDDVGYRLVALYTPVREDGVEGQPVSASTEPIAVEPDILKEVKQKLDLGSVKFEVPGMGSLERRILEVNRKRIKVVKPGSKTSFPTTEIRGSYAPPFHVELFRNEQHRIRIVVDSENEVDLLVQTRHLRDVIVLVIRGLAQRFNSTSLNSLLKIDT
ncbi:hypothetical protein TEA_014867 [Camellia sinensis var. sinensis]|uniref:Uncharacterized protein n=1 Tax=Camellia sinensis var. sinensis TaxID=542762 RepID=A0A4V3WLD6_CAMSN|nr:hypothetical protein TEA_014867 [Camellia sinensis var. sinensis]